MTLHVPLSADAEAALRERAAAAGQDLAAYAAGVLERLAAPARSLREISGPLTAEFEASGMTEDQLSDLLEHAKHEARGRSAS